MLFSDVTCGNWLSQPSSLLRTLVCCGGCLLSPFAISQPAEGGGEGTDQCLLLIEPGTADFDISEVENPVEGIPLPSGTVIGDIVFTTYPIFDPNDPKENNALFQLADFLHIDTQPRILADLLLFESGDALNLRELEESARILRDTDYLYEARIWPYRICDDRVDIEVLTREVWTLSGGVSVSRSGGNEDSRVSLSDSNFLGRGESVSVAYSSSTDRSGYEFSYADPSVVGTRHSLEVFFANNDDGRQTEVEIQRPFFSLNTPRAWGLYYNNDERIDDLYERGEEIASFRTQQQQTEVFWGTSDGWRDGVTRRTYYGWRAEESTYEVVEDIEPPDNFPENREVNYPFISYSKIEEDYIKASNLNQMHRIEDFNLGRTWTATLGWADENLGSNRDRLVYSAEWRDAWQLNEHTLMQLDLTVSGMWRPETNQSEDLQTEANWRYYDGVRRNQGTYMALDMHYTRKMPNDQQILLGAEEQLRGYPDRYQSGDRSVVFTIERRYYTDWHLFRLLRIGGAVFFDVGRAWESGDPSEGATGWLADAGFGLRIASSRAETKRILHIDVAFPFEDQDDIDSMQVLVTAKQSF